MDRVHVSDVRFGSTFLDVDYKDKSVRGEILSDKMDGELYLRRPIDDRIVSFSQKASSSYEMMKDFNIQFLTAEGFKYPTDNSYFAGVKFDVNELSELEVGELRPDLLKKNNILPGRSSADDEFSFLVSDVTNGFFIKPILRYGDRNVVGFLTGEFRSREQQPEFHDDFVSWLDSQDEVYGAGAIYDVWKGIEGWNEGNAIMSYTIEISGINTSGNQMVKRIPDIAMIRLNEHTFVQFPISYRLNMDTVDWIRVTITSIQYPKLQYISSKYRNANDGYYPYMANLMEPDYKVNLREAEVFYFVDKPDQLPPEIHSTIHHFVDYGYLVETINKIKAGSIRPYVSQPEELDDGEWHVDSVWNEELRRISQSNKIYQFPTATTTVAEIEKRIYYNSGIEVEFTTMESTKTGIYVEEVSRVI